MKKNYQTPNMMIVDIENDNVIMTSGTNISGDNAGTKFDPSSTTDMGEGEGGAAGAYRSGLWN